mgnify:CR=1 FL=1
MELSVIKKEFPVEQLKELQVGLVYLFGSYAEGMAGEGSDIDVGVVMTDKALVKGSITEIYNKLFDVFTDVFDMSNFKTIDIVFLDRAPLELCFDVISHGVTLYELSTEFRMNFEDHIEALYRDFYPVLQEFNRALLARI